MSNIIKSIFIGVLLFGATALTVSALNTSTVYADGEDNHSNDTAQTENAGSSYVYEAQPADTYTQIARKAIQTYGIENSVNLTGAEIIFAETRMTLEAGSPVLNTGQKLEVSKETVKKWVEEAQKLDEATEARWNRYVQDVDFNTNNVGEKRTA